MKQLFLVIAGILISGCAQTAKTTSPEPAAQAEERVLIRSSRGNKEVLICSPRIRHNEDRVIVRLQCEGKQVLALQSFQTVYEDKVAANESVRIYWRDDGNAVVVNLLVSGGSQETRPYYIVWDGCSAAEVSYKPIWPDNHAGESNIYFDGWDNSGKPILKVE
jgi:hypothetical protein